MPQSWEEHWDNLTSKFKLDGELMTEDESRNDRYEKIGWIGNMTLLTTHLNSSLRNYNYITKMEGEGRKKGIKSYADLVITRDDLVIPYDSGEVLWDEDKIVSRTQHLLNEINTIWKKN